MSKALVLQFGGQGHLIPKPDTYDNLLIVTRMQFKELENLEDANIIFRFTPDWCDVEVQVDAAAFEFIHHQAKVFVLAPALLNAVKDEVDQKPQPLQRLKREPDSLDHVSPKKRLAETQGLLIDLTDSDLEIERHRSASQPLKRLKREPDSLEQAPPKKRPAKTHKCSST